MGIGTYPTYDAGKHGGRPGGAPLAGHRFPVRRIIYQPRYRSRRWTAQAAQGAAGDLGQVGHILLLEAIDAARQGNSAAMSEAVAAGLVHKRVSPGDARRAELTITASGARLLRTARDWQETVLAELVSGWPKGDARRFARYLRRLADETQPS